jgi:hypothetical protein
MTSVSGGLEKVEWSPDLYRRNDATGAWYLYDGTRPWYYAFANSNGPVYLQYSNKTWSWPNGARVDTAAYNYLPAGTYAVVDHYRWSNGATVDVWSHFRAAVGGYSCPLYP